MSDVIVDPVVVPVVPPAPAPAPTPAPVVPVTPIDPAVITQYTNLILSLLDSVVSFVPGQAGVVVKNIDTVVHTIVSQSWFNEILTVVVNLIHGGKAPTKQNVFDALMKHMSNK